MSDNSNLNEIIKSVFASLDAADRLSEEDVALPSFSSFCKEDAENTMAGQVVGGWQIKELIGQGGMAAVYLVERTEESIKQQAALKILPIELASHQVVERFVRERQILVDLDHSHIAKLLDLGVTDSNIPWYVMAYFEGQDIISFLGTVNTDLTQKTMLFKQICEAIAYAHKQGVVHRDIKPGNILVNDQFEIKVLDFGIALKDENTSLTMTGAVLGTPGYMSPEQSKGRNDLVDARSDVFSLGTLFYHMLVGNKPFVADSAAEMGAQIINEEPKPMDHHIPVDLQAIIHQCLAKEPDQRYATARALSRDVEAYLNGDVISAKPVSWAGYWLKKSKKHPKTTAFITLFFLLGLSAVGFGLYQNHLNNRQLKAAEVFVKQAEDIKNQVRRLHMLPVHNVQPEYVKIRQQILDLQQKIINSGADQSGLTDLALGSTYMSMRDYDQALPLLQKANNKGWQSLELDRQLGNALALEWFYQKKQSKKINDETEKETYLTAAKENYYNPAKKLLDKTQDQSSYLAGRLAWIEERYDDAIVYYQQELLDNPWHHEAAKQISEVYMNKFRSVSITQGYDKAMPYMDLSNQYLQQAIEIGRSDPLNHVSRCTNAGTDIQIKRFLKKYEDMPKAFTEGMQACENALVLEPTAFSPWANMIHMLLSKAMMFEAQQQDTADLYQQALSIVERGIQQHPTKIELLVTRIKPLIKIAEANIENGDDPNEYFELARNTAQQAIELDSSSSLGWKELGRIHWAMADYFGEESKDVDKAISNLKAAQQAFLSEQQNQISATAQLNAALITGNLADIYAGTGDLETAVETMTASIERRIKQIPSSKNYFSYLHGTLEDFSKLISWSQSIEASEGVGLIVLLTALVEKSCGISGVSQTDSGAFNDLLSIVSSPLIEPPIFCEVSSE